MVSRLVNANSLPLYTVRNTCRKQHVSTIDLIDIHLVQNDLLKTKGQFIGMEMFVSGCVLPFRATLSEKKADLIATELNTSVVRATKLSKSLLIKKNLRPVSSHYL
jgi:hypothetical protein